MGSRSDSLTQQAVRIQQNRCRRKSYPTRRYTNNTCRAYKLVLVLFETEPRYRIRSIQQSFRTRNIFYACYHWRHHRHTFFNPNCVNPLTQISDNTSRNRQTTRPETVWDPVAQNQCRAYSIMGLPRDRILFLRAKSCPYPFFTRWHSYCLLCLCMDLWILEFHNSRRFRHTRWTARIATYKLHARLTSYTRFAHLSDLGVVSRDYLGEHRLFSENQNTEKNQWVAPLKTPFWSKKAHRV